MTETAALEDLSRDPYPILARMRAREPVAWVDEQKMWFVTRRDDVVEVLSDPVTYTVDTDESFLRDIFGRTMLSTDGDAQHRLRHPASQPFTPKAIRSFAAQVIEVTANGLVDGFIERGETDLVAEFCDRLALGTVATILGIPVRDHHLFRGWYDDFAAALGNFSRDPAIRQRGLDAAEAFGSHVAPLVERLRGQPDASVLSAMVHWPGALTPTEIVSAAMLILFGGLETTQAMLGNTLWALFTHSSALAELRSDASLIRAVVEESLRWEAPVQSCTRWTTRKVTLRGVDIEGGEVVQCMLGAANRDPERFADPDRFDHGRANAAEHLSFGAGKHFCIGAALARQEGLIALPILLNRLPCLELDMDRTSPPRGHEFRSPPALRAVWAN